MKTFIILLFCFISSSICLPINKTDSLVKAEIIPNIIDSGTVLDSIEIIIYNNSDDSLLFLTEPYFAFGRFLKEIEYMWFWSLRKSFTNAIFFDEMNNHLFYSDGDGQYIVKFSPTAKLLCITPNNKLKITFLIKDFIKEYCISKDINIYTYLEYRKFSDVRNYLVDKINSIDKLNSILLYDEKYYCDIITLKELKCYNEKSDNNFLDSIIYGTKQYVVVVERK
jgi:hypothetical protein